VPRPLAVTNPADGSAVGSIDYGKARTPRRRPTVPPRLFQLGRRARRGSAPSILNRVAQLLAERAGEIGLLLAREAGKRTPEGVGERPQMS